MMSKLCALLFVISSYCSAFSPELTGNLNKAFYLDKEEGAQVAVDFISTIIERQQTPDVDKVHYLLARADFNISMGNKDLRKMDLEIAKELIISDLLCQQDFFAYYYLTPVFFEIFPNFYPD